jgi:very-short-patch-repair endonuclease
VHVYHCHGDEVFFAALESALRQRKISSAATGRIRARLPLRARWLVDLARADADSGLESLLRLRLHVLGIRLECQVAIPTVGIVDFVVGDRLILETDGKENHDGASHRHKDLRRDAAASRLGYETLRFDYALVIHDWPTVEAAILAALARLIDRG